MNEHRAGIETLGMFNEHEFTEANSDNSNSDPETEKSERLVLDHRDIQAKIAYEDASFRRNMGATSLAFAAVCFTSFIVFGALTNNYKPSVQFWTCAGPFVGYIVRMFIER